MTLGSSIAWEYLLRIFAGLAVGFCGGLLYMWWSKRR